MGDWSSEVHVRDEPSENDEGYAKTGVKPKPCGGCGNEATTCVSARGGGSIIGTWSEEEFHCDKCGKYTVYVEEYES